MLGGSDTAVEPSGPEGTLFYSKGAHGYVKIELAGEPLRASTEDCDSNKAEADGILEAIKAVVGEDVVATATY